MVLDRAYADLLQIGQPSRGGALNPLTILDDHTRKLWAFPLGRKREVIDKFGEWLAQVQNFTGHKLKQFGSDGGGEFTSRAMQKLLTDNGT